MENTDQQPNLEQFHQDPEGHTAHRFAKVFIGILGLIAAVIVVVVVVRFIKNRPEPIDLPETSEFKPLIKDFNQDGKLDLLVNCRDGKLYCFDLKIAANNLTINQ